MQVEYREENDGDFVPDYGGWIDLFGKLEYVLGRIGVKKEAGIYKDSNSKISLGGCYHYSSSVPRILNSTGLLEDYNRVYTELNKRFPIKIGLHSTFGNRDLILNENYFDVLKNDIKLAKSVNACTIVEHPYLGSDNKIKEMVETFERPEFVELLENNDITLSWENMPGFKRFFSSLGNLIEFRGALSDMYKEIGKSDLINKHTFCLDTGHLLITLNSRSLSKKAKRREIEEYLPIFSKHLEVFHIHANSGKIDEHLTPFSARFLEDPTRKGLKMKKFMKNSERVLEWIEICNQNRGNLERHIHIEALRLPFSLEDFIDFGKKLFI